MTTTLNICRIDCASDDAREAIRELRRQLSPEGNVVSPQGRGPHDRGVRRAADAAAGRRADLRRRAVPRPRGRARLHGPARRRRTLDPADGPGPARRAGRGVQGGRPGLSAHAPPRPRNILAFQTGILHRDAILRRGPNCELRLRYRPLRRVGVCIPGGRGGVSVVAPDDGRPGAGGGGRGDRRGRAADRRSAATTPTCSPPATPWA